MDNNIKKEFKKILLFLLVLVGLLLVIQGLLLKQIIPLEPFLLLIGISSDVLGLFIIPFFIFFIKFMYLLFGSTVMLVVELKNNRGKEFDPNLPSASILGSPRFNVSKKMSLNFHSFFSSLMFEFFLWIVLFISTSVIVGLYISLGFIENNEQGILPLFLNLFVGFYLISLFFVTFKENPIIKIFNTLRIN